MPCEVTKPSGRSTHTLRSISADLISSSCNGVRHRVELERRSDHLAHAPKHGSNVSGACNAGLLSDDQWAILVACIPTYVSFAHARLRVQHDLLVYVQVNPHNLALALFATSSCHIAAFDPRRNLK